MVCYSAKDYPDGTHIDYTYDVRGNLTTVSDARRHDLRLSYEDTQFPDLLTKISYPDGRLLQYQYKRPRPAHGEYRRVGLQGGLRVLRRRAG